MMAVLSVLGAILGFILKLILWLLLIIVLLILFVLLCPFCADIHWQNGIFKLKVGLAGITFPVMQLPKPEPQAAPTESEPPKGVWGRFKAKLRAAVQKRK
jgi:hypothetical protein